MAAGFAKVNRWAVSSLDRAPEIAAILHGTKCLQS